MKNYLINIDSQPITIQKLLESIVSTESKEFKELVNNTDFSQPMTQDQLDYINVGTLKECVDKSNFRLLLSGLLEAKGEKVDGKAVFTLLKSLYLLPGPYFTNTIYPLFQESIATSASLLTSLNKGGNFKEMLHAFMEHGIKFSAKYHTEKHDFIITSSPDRNTDYIGWDDIKNIKEDSKTYFLNGQIYSTKTGKIISDYDTIRYVMSKKGVLYIDIDQCNIGAHTYFLKGKGTNSVGEEWMEDYNRELVKKVLWGYGRPVASAGHLSIKDGKITIFDGGSGHYRPTADQIKVAAHYLWKQGVLAENYTINYYSSVQCIGKNIFNNDNDSMVSSIGDILNQYPLVEY